MSNNYPAGVSDNHPYFNPPKEIAAGVECGADEALVVPSFAVKAELLTLRLEASAIPTANAIYERLGLLLSLIDELEQEREYECPFNDEVDLEESECARWDCPVCGNERETDTMPEDRDPDEAWDRRGDDD